MNVFFQILHYGGVLFFTLWASLILKDVVSLSYSSFFKESPPVAAHNVLLPLVKNFPGYFTGAIIPAVLLIPGAIAGSRCEVSAAQVNIQIILLAVVIVAVGVVWSIVLLIYAALHTKKIWSFVFLSIDFLLVAVPLVLLLASLAETSLSKAFLLSLPVVAVASFLAKAAYWSNEL